MRLNLIVLILHELSLSAFKAAGPISPISKVTFLVLFDSLRISSRFKFLSRESSVDFIPATPVSVLPYQYNSIMVIDFIKKIVKIRQLRLSEFSAH